MASSPRPSWSSTPPHDDQGWYKSFTAAGRTSSKTSTSEPKLQRSFWSSLAKRAKAALLDDDVPTYTSSDSELGQKQQVSETSKPQYTQAKPSAESRQRRTDAPTLQKQQVSETSKLQYTQAKPSAESRQRRTDAPTLQKGFEAITSSLSILGGTIGNAIEEGLNIVETKASDFMSSDSRLLSMKKKVNTAKSNQQQGPSFFEDSAADKETQLKASRDVAMAMAAKAKLLLREMKTVKADLAFAKDRCMQLEEENKRIRESLANGSRPDEEDWVRVQLETLLAEKARLAQENAYYARENHYLLQVVEYHQLTMQDVVLLDESIVEVAEMANEPATEKDSEEQPPERVISTVSG